MTETVGEVLSNGEVVEVVRASANAAKIELLHFDGKKATSGEQLTLHGITYAPGHIDSSVLHAMRLPYGVNAFGSAKTLIADIAGAIQNFTGLEEHLSRLSAFYITMTWFPDCLHVAPRLTVFGPACRAADQFMRLSAAFCRHTIVLSNISPGGLLSLPFPFDLTILISQHRIPVRMMPLLDAMTKSGQFVSQRGKLVCPFSPVVMHLDKPLGEFTNCAGVEVPIWPARHDPPLLDSQAEDAVTKQFQSRLLGYRLENLAKVSRSTFHAPDLSSPMGETARSLGICFPDDPELQQEIVELLRAPDAHARLIRATDPESLVIEALLFHAHEAQGDPTAAVYAGQVAETVAVLSAGRGEPQELEPRSVGELLRSLGFRTERLDRYGRGVILLDNTVTKIHQLAQDRQVPYLTVGSPRCAQCRNLQESQTEGGFRAPA